MIIENHPLYYANTPMDEILPFLKIFTGVKKKVKGVKTALKLNRGRH